MATTSSAAAFSIEELAIRQWATHHQYWGKIAPDDQRFRAALDSSSVRGLRAQYEEAQNKAQESRPVQEKPPREPTPSLSFSQLAHLAQAREAAKSCPYCFDNGNGVRFVEFRYANGTTRTGRCSHNRKQLLRYAKKEQVKIVLQNKHYQPSSEEEEFVV